MSDINNVTVLIPGGFKPPHGGHLALVNVYARNPAVKEVIIMIGPKEREGVTREQGIAIWKLLIPNNPKVKILGIKTENPLAACYDYAFDLPQNYVGNIAMGASTKGEDSLRSKDFVVNINGKYKTIGDKAGRKVAPGVNAVLLTANVNPLMYKGREDGQTGGISATTLRHDLVKRDYNNFKTNYPGIDGPIVKQIYNILIAKQPIDVVKEHVRQYINMILEIDESGESDNKFDTQIKSKNTMAADAIVKAKKTEELAKKDKLSNHKKELLGIDTSIDTTNKSPDQITKERDTIEDKRKLAKEKIKNAEVATKSAGEAVKSAVNKKNAVRTGGSI